MAEERAVITIEAQSEKFEESLRKAREAALAFEQAQRKIYETEGLTIAQEKEMVAALKRVEALRKQGLTTSERTAEKFVEVERIQRKLGQTTQTAAAMAALQIKGLDQTRREAANAGRSLSMLFDEQNNLLRSMSNFPGPAGKMARSMSGVAEAFKVATDANQTGSASIAALIGLWGTLGTAAVAAGAAIAKAGADVAETTDHLDKMAAGVGLSTIELSRFQVLASKAVPGGIDQVAKALQKLSKAQDDAASGSAGMADALARMGVAGETPEELFLSLAAGAERMGNTAERSATLTRLLGDDLARQLAPALQLGADGVAALLAENDRYNLTLTEETIKNTADYKDATAELAAAWDGAKMSAAGVIPALTHLAREAQFFVDEPGSALADLLTLGLFDGFEKWRGEIERTNKTLAAMAAGTARAAEMASLLRDATSADGGAAPAAAEFAATLEMLRATNEAAMTPAERHRAEIEALGVAAGVSKAEIDEMLAAYDEKIARDQQAAKDAERAASEAMKLAEQQARGHEVSVDQALQSLAIVQNVEGLKRLELQRTADLDLDLSSQIQQFQQQQGEAEIVSYAQIQAAKVSMIEQTYASFVDVLEQFGQRSEAARKAALVAQAASALRSIAISTAENISKAAGLFAFPSPPGIAAVTAAAALGVAQAAAVVSGTVSNLRGGKAPPPATAPSATSSGSSSAASQPAQPTRGAFAESVITGSGRPSDAVRVSDAYVPPSMGRRTIEMIPGDEAFIQRGGSLGMMDNGATVQMLGAQIAATVEQTEILRALRDVLLMRQVNGSAMSPARGY